MGLLNQESYHRAADCHDKLGNPIRYTIYRLVGEHEEVTSAEIAGMIDREQSNVSQHLALFKDKDMVQSRRDGNDVYYKIKRQDIYDLVIKFEDLFNR